MTPNANQVTVKSLAARLDELEARLTALTSSLASSYQEPEECRQRACTYYQHYLAYGPAELTHEGYHAAEKRCDAAQQACSAYHDRQGYTSRSLDPCCRVAEHWERAVRA